MSESWRAHEELQRALDELQLAESKVQTQSQALRDAEARLEASRQDYWELFHLAPLGYLVLGKRLIVQRINREARRLLGVASQERVGQSLGELIHPDESAAVVERLVRLRREGGGARLEVRLSSDPARILRLIAASPEGGGRLLVTVEDVSDEHALREAMALSEARFEAIVDTAVDALIVTDTSGTIEHVNPACLQIFGYDRAEELVGQPVEILVPAVHKERHPTYIQRLLRSGEQLVLGRQLEATRRDGTELRLELGVRVIQPRHGQAKLVALLRDRTQEFKLEAERDWLFESTVDLLVVVDATGRILQANTGANTLLGKPGKDLAGLAFAELPTRADRSRLAKSLSAFLAGGGPTLEVEARYPTITETRWVSWRLRRHPTLGAVYAVGRDVSRTRFEQEAQASRQRLEALGELAGGIAHDFNNALTVIGGHLELLSLQRSKDDKVQRTVSTVEVAIRSAAEMTRQLLAFGRHATIELRAVDMVKSIKEGFGLLERVVPERLRLQLHAPAGPLWVVGDRAQLHQALTNLVLNSRDAIDGVGTIHVRIEPEDERVRLVVEDDGQGIPPEDLSRLFEPFFTTKGKGKGSGLGLAMVYGYAQRCGGSCEVKSEQGFGARFELTFPVSDPPKKRKPSGPHTNPPRKSEQLVLVAEDEPGVRQLVQETLTHAGYRVLCAEDGAAALALAREHPALSLVVTDVVMPVMSGAELASHLNKERPGLPVLCCTGYVEEHDIKLLPEGVRLLNKPFRRKALLQAVEELLLGEEAD